MLAAVIIALQDSSKRGANILAPGHQNMSIDFSKHEGLIKYTVSRTIQQRGVVENMLYKPTRLLHN